MSRVAKRPVDLPQGVTATVASNLVKVKGAKGELSLTVADGVTVETQDKKLQVGFASPQSDINKSWGSGWGVRLLDKLVADYYEK